MNQSFYGWKLLAVMWVVLAFTMGFAVNGGNVMNTYMVLEMHLDRKSLGIVGGAFLLCMGLFSPLTGVFVQKWGAKKAFIAGTLIVALGALAMATIVDTVTGAAIAYGLAMGGGATLAGTIPAQTVIGYWFRKRVALALTIGTSGAVAGGAIATPLLSKVIVAANGNWRIGWIIVAATSAVAFFCAILFVRNKPADIGQVQDGVVEADASSDARAASPAASGVYKTTEDWTFKDAIRQPIFWMMLFGLSIAVVASGMVGAHGLANFKDLGHSPEMAALSLSIMAVSGLLGTGIFAILGDRIEPRFLWSAALTGCAIGLALAVTATSAIELFVTSFLIGAGPMLAISSMFTLTLNYYGKTAYAALMGVSGVFVTLVPAAIIVLTGMAYDHFGGYALAFYPGAALCFLGGLMIPFARPPVRALGKLATC